MSDPVRALRPQIDTFQGEGWLLTIVDVPAVLAEAADHPVEVLHGAVFGWPVRRARMSVAAGSRDGRPVFVLDAAIHSGGRPGATRSRVVGNDPIGALLSWRVGAGDQRAVRVLDGLETAVGEVFRRLGMPPPTAAEPSWAEPSWTEPSWAEPSWAEPSWENGRPPRSEIVVDDATGLRTTVTQHTLADDRRIITLQAAVARGVMSAAHLAALFEVMVRVVGELRGDKAGGDRTDTQRTFVMSTHPLGDPGARTEYERVTFDQVGGLDDVVDQFREVAISFRHPEAMARWGARRPQGILLYGPPGTGKTMLAHALANEIGGSLREVRTPEILDKWLGSSERNIKRIFHEARRYRVPTVLLFDEFDSIISYAGAGVDSGSQAVNAVAGIFKQEMNTLIEQNPNVVVVATTNFPHLIDESLIRSGRFDLRLEIPMPDAEGRAQIITRMVRRLIAAHEVSGFQMFADDIDVDELAARSEGMTGADLREALRRAQMVKAMQEARTGVRASPIGHDDLRDRINELR